MHALQASGITYVHHSTVSEINTHALYVRKLGLQATFAVTGPSFNYRLRIGYGLLCMPMPSSTFELMGRLTAEFPFAANSAPIQSVVHLCSCVVVFCFHAHRLNICVVYHAVSFINIRLLHTSHM